MKISTLIIILVSVVVTLIAGFFIGAWYQRDILAPEIGDCIKAKAELNEALPKVENFKAILTALNSPLIHSSGAVGNISNLDIEKKSLTLYSEGASLDILINNDIVVERVASDNQRTPAALKDIKKEDVLNIFLNFSDNGQVTTSKIFIMTAIYNPTH